MNKEEVTLSKLQGLLKTVETGLKGKSVVNTPTQNSTPVLAIGKNRGKKRKRRVPRLGPLMDLLQVEPRKVSLLLLLIQKRLNASIAMKIHIGSGTAQNTSKM